MLSSCPPKSIRLFVLFSAICLFMIPVGEQPRAESQGESGFQYSVTPDAATGTTTLEFQSPASMSDAQVLIERQDGQRIRRSVGDVDSGDSIEVTFKQSAGTHRYTGKLSGLGDDDQSMSFNFQMEVTLGSEFTVDLLRDEVDLGARTVPVYAHQPVESLQLRITDGDDQPAVDETRPMNGQSGRIEVQWQEEVDEVSQLQIEFHDRHGSWYRHTIQPIQVRIPEQIISFETGSATIDTDDIHKLRTTFGKIGDILDEHEEFRSELRLYVAGYTDTVGSAQNNLVLSERRARSIAQWFRQQGVDIPIYYQGFGQEVLAVDTPDQTEEKRNRRAVYIIANTPPAQSRDIPRSNWKRLP